MRMLEGKAADAYVADLKIRGSRLEEVEPTVRRIVEDVRRDKDRTLLKYAHEFDRLEPNQNLRVSDSELKDAAKRAPASLKTALSIAAKNISQFCEWEKPKE